MNAEAYETLKENPELRAVAAAMECIVTGRPLGKGGITMTQYPSEAECREPRSIQEQADGLLQSAEMARTSAAQILLFCGPVRPGIEGQKTPDGPERDNLTLRERLELVERALTATAATLSEIEAALGMVSF